jgi:hypothetical protein
VPLPETERRNILLAVPPQLYGAARRELEELSPAALANALRWYRTASEEELDQVRREADELIEAHNKYYGSHSCDGDSCLAGV